MLTKGDVPRRRRVMSRMTCRPCQSAAPAAVDCVCDISKCRYDGIQMMRKSEWVSARPASTWPNCVMPPEALPLLS